MDQPNRDDLTSSTDLSTEASESGILPEKVAPVSITADDSEDVSETSGNGVPTAAVTSDDTNDKDAPSTSDTNPYAYLNRDEFTSEKFKIEVSGLPKHYGFSELRKLFNNKLKVNVHKMIPPRKGCTFMFVNFKSEEDRQLAIEKIDGYVWKNKTLSAKRAKAAEDPLMKKRLNEEIDNGESGFAPTETVDETIRRVTTPWWNVPYDEQLNRKMTIVKEVFWEMRKGILNVQSNLKNGLHEDMIEMIKPSPVLKEYRNKCEFSVGYHPETKEKTVGFRLSSYKKGSTAVGPINNVNHVPQCMVNVVLKFQDFVRQSKYDVYHPETHEGCFRQVTVRATANDDVMMIVGLSKKKISDDDFELLKNDLRKEFCNETGDNNVKSFYIKYLTDYGHPDNNPPELLFGSETIIENLLGRKFEISPEAFFQVNLSATEVLYKTIGDLLDEQNSTLLDVCSGTGTIGISVSDKCSQVLGIEMIASAVSDARKNAEINGLSAKCDFFAGKAEDITEPVIVRAKSSNIIAVVDPPRAGLHQKVLFTLRKCDKINTLIYVACNAKAAMKNFIDLARPNSKGFKGKPFIPVKLIPVDMFPHSPHFELIIVFERLPSLVNDS